MQTAFTSLSPEDASAMSEKLKEDGIPFQLTNGGTTIEVPKEKIAETRVGLASSGLPKGGTTGYELFDKQSFGATDFSQRVNYQRALEGELSRTISELEEVESARVHIALGKESVFVDKEKPATAAVIMKLRAGSEITGRQGKGIVRLVAGSVEGLKPDNVTLTDISGNLLTAENGSSFEDDGGSANSNQSAQQKYERDMESRLNGLLAAALGQSKVVTKVAAEMDFDQTEEKSTTYTPVVNGQGIVSEETTADETFEGARAPGGTVGTASNIPGQIGTTASDTATSSYGKGGLTRKYKVNQVDTIKKKAVGTVKRQTVAVLVDGKLTPAETDRVRGIVEAGAGIDIARGDSVRVESLPFNDSVTRKAEEAIAAEGKQAMYLDIVKYALLIVGLVMFFLFLMSRMRRSRDVMGSGEPFFQSPESLEAYAPAQIAAAEQRSVAARNEVAALEAEKKPVEHMVEDRPDDAARLVRAWLKTGN